MGVTGWLGLGLAALVVLWLCRYPNGPKVYLYSVMRWVARRRALARVARWPCLCGPRLKVWYEPGTDPAMAQIVLRVAEEYLDPVARLLGGGLAGEKIPVVVYRERRSLGEGLGWSPEENAMGLYWAGVVRILSPSDWIGADDPAQTEAVFRREGPVAHELAHLLVDYRARGNYPRWLTEGIAQQVERRLTGCRAPGFAGSFARWYALEALDRDFDALPDQDLAYRQSLLLADFLAGSCGPEGLVPLLDALGRGCTLAQALRRVLGRSAADLERFLSPKNC